MVFNHSLARAARHSLRNVNYYFCSGFANFAGILLGMAHVHIPLTILFAACAIVAWYVS